MGEGTALTMIEASATITIHRPIQDVFQFAANVVNLALWVKGARFRQLSGGPFGEGTRFEQTTSDRGRTFTAVLEVRTYRVNEGYETHRVAPPFPMISSVGSMRFASTADGTQVTLARQVRLAFWLRPLEGVQRQQLQATFQQALTQLKSNLEH